MTTENHEKKCSYSKDTQKYENQATLSKKGKVYHLEGEFKKMKPTTFDKELKAREEAEAWLLNIKKHFQIYNYSSNMRV